MWNLLRCKKVRECLEQTEEIVQKVKQFGKVRRSVKKYGKLLREAWKKYNVWFNQEREQEKLKKMKKLKESARKL